MADKFSKAALGEAVLVIAKANYKAAGAIEKGDVVVFTAHQDDELATISAGGDASALVAGVAMKDIAVGAYGPVLKIGIIKVTAGAAGVTVGKHIESAEDGEVEDGATATKVIGRAEQTFTHGDTGLVFIQAVGGGA